MKLKEEDIRVAGSNDGDSIEHTCKEDDDIFSMKEIKIEEMAIDGICGVY